MTQKHTPLPWAVEFRPRVHEWWIGSALKEKQRGLKIEQMTCAIKAMTGNHVSEAEENAAFIVRACNSHYELLEALKEAHAEIRAWRDGLNSKNMHAAKVGAKYADEKQIVAAIAKAAGGQ